MIDLIKIIGAEYFLEIIDFVKQNPRQNASSISKILGIHIVTIQRYLDTLEKYSYVKTEQKRSLGRPSKLYTFTGGIVKVDFDVLLHEYQMRTKRIRESGHPDVAYSYDIDKEIVNAILVGGKTGQKIKLDEKEGRFMWMIPPPDSEGEIIENIAHKAGEPISDAIKFILDFSKFKIFEVYE